MIKNFVAAIKWNHLCETLTKNHLPNHEFAPDAHEIIRIKLTEIRLRGILCKYVSTIYICHNNFDTKKSPKNDFELPTIYRITIKLWQY